LKQKDLVQVLSHLPLSGPPAGNATAEVCATRPDVIIDRDYADDAAVVRGTGDAALVLTADVIAPIVDDPETFGAIAATNALSDIWAMGGTPRYALALAFFPDDQLPLDVLAAILRGGADACARAGVAVVGGHTGRHPGSGSTLVGAATLIGIGDEGRWIGAPFVQPGDRMIVTGGCAIETAAVAVHLFPRKFERFAREMSSVAGEVEQILERARGLIDRVSVVEDCRIAIQCGVRDQGVSALHDATEGGVLGGLVEFARAAGCDLRIERAKIPVSPEARVACAAFGIDPYTALAEGALLVAARPEHAGRVLDVLRASGTEAAEIGEFVRGPGIVWWAEPEDKVVRIEDAPPDPYWAAYQRAVTEGWE